MKTPSSKGPIVMDCQWGLCRVWLGTAVACMFILYMCTAGCGSPEQEYQPVTGGVSAPNEDIVCITAVDLGVPPEAIADAEHESLDSSPSTARFPTGVSVVRVVAAMDEKDARRYLRVAEMPQESAVYWCHLWDDLSPIRGVTMLRTLGLDPCGANHEDLLRESTNANCGLCIIYARVDDTDADADFAAVLWDAANRKALSAFRVPVTLSEEDREVSEKAHRGGPWVSEAEFRAEADLRKLIRDVMWDLVANDQVSPMTQPSPWQDYLPLFPRDYDRFRRFERVEKLRDQRKPKAESRKPKAESRKPKSES